jgi:hypothetical protein
MVEVGCLLAEARILFSEIYRVYLHCGSESAFLDIDFLQTDSQII